MVNYDAQDGFSVSSSLPTTVHSDATLSELVNNGDSSNPSNSSNTQLAVMPSAIDEEAISISTTSTTTTSSSSSLSSSIRAVAAMPSTSVLIIQEVNFKHAGNYTCAPSNARPTSITVHVLKSKSSFFIHKLHDMHANNSSHRNKLSYQTFANIGITSTFDFIFIIYLSTLTGMQFRNNYCQRYLEYKPTNWATYKHTIFENGKNGKLC